MSQFIINTIGISFTPASRSEDGMTETVAHFCAACPIGGNPMGLVAAGWTEDDAIYKLRQKYAEAINAGKVPGVERGDGSDICAYQIETGRVIRIDYPEDVLRKALAEEHSAALRMNGAFDLDASRRAIKKRYETEKEEYLKGIDLAGISISLEDDAKVKVWGLNEYNPHYHRRESVYPTKTFPRRKDGSWNWSKIRNHVMSISNHLTAKRSGLAARDNVRKQASEIAQRLGFDKYSTAWEPGQKNVLLHVHVPVDKFEEVINTIRALGITLK